MKINLDDLMGQCNCGKNHALDIKEIIIEEAPVLICDKNTYNAGGKALYAMLTGHKKHIIVLQEDKIYADEKAVQEVINGLGPEITGLIAVGAGTLHDITRYVAKKHMVPFVRRLTLMRVLKPIQP